MSWFIRIVVTALLLSIQAQVCTGQDNPDFVPYRVKNKWGFADTTGKVWIKPKYQSVNFFQTVYLNRNQSFLALAQLKNKWGLIDKQNKIAVPFLYDSVAISIELDSSAFVRKNNKWGIRKLYKGEIVGCSINSFLEIFDKSLLLKKEAENRALATNLNGNANPTENFDRFVHYPAWDKKFRNPEGKRYLPGTNTEIYLPFEIDKYGGYSYWTEAGAMQARNFGKWGLVDTSGQLLIPFIYDSLVCFNYNSDMRLKVMKNNKWGLVSREGKLILPIQYDKISATVAMEIHNPNSRKKNPTNKLQLSQGIGWVQKNGKWYLLNRNGKYSLTQGYEEVESVFVWAEKDAPTLTIVKANGKFGIIAVEANKEIIPCKFDSIKFNYTTNGMYLEKSVPVLVGQAGSFGLYNISWYGNITAKEILPIAFDSLQKAQIYYDCSKVDSAAGKMPLYDGHNFVIWGKSNGKWKLFNSEGKPLIPNEYSHLDFKILKRWYKERVPLIAIKEKGNWGVISVRGKQILPFSFDSINRHTHLIIVPNSNNYFNQSEIILVKERSQFNTFDFNGNLLLTLPYSEVEIIPVAYDVAVGYKVKTPTGWQMLDFNGKKVSPETYQEIAFFKNDYLDRFQLFSSIPQLFKVKQNNKTGILNNMGKVVIPIEYEKIEAYEANLIKVWYKGNPGYLNLKTGQKYFKD